jgi:hypothetical protein
MIGTNKINENDKMKKMMRIAERDTENDESPIKL